MAFSLKDEVKNLQNQNKNEIKATKSKIEDTLEEILPLLISDVATDLVNTTKNNIWQAVKGGSLSKVFEGTVVPNCNYEIVININPPQFEKFVKTDTSKLSFLAWNLKTLAEHNIKGSDFGFAEVVSKDKNISAFSIVLKSRHLRNMYLKEIKKIAKADKIKIAADKTGLITYKFVVR